MLNFSNLLSFVEKRPTIAIFMTVFLLQLGCLSLSILDPSAVSKLFIQEDGGELLEIRIHINITQLLIFSKTFYIHTQAKSS